MNHQTAISSATSFLEKIINEHVTEKEQTWFKQQQEKFSKKPQFVTLVQVFNTSSRFIRKDTIQLSEEQLIEADAIRIGLQLNRWNLLEVVRVYFLIQLPHEDEAQFKRDLNRLYETSDLDQQVAFYKALPLLPHPDQLIGRATEGIRTNITDVFDAIALNNPFPSDFLNQDAWNQMVLKAVFMGRPLYLIHDAGTRMNADLADILIDFAHERWAAHRPVTPELWRFVGPYLTTSQLPDIQRVLSGSPLEKEAGVLACSQGPLTSADNPLEEYPNIKNRIRTGELNWFEIGKKHQDLNQH